MTDDAHAIDLLALFGRGAGTGTDLVQAVRNGLPIGAVDCVLRSGRLTLAEMEQLVLSRRAMRSRRKLGRLTPVQSDRLVRTVRVVTEAEKTFGGSDKAAAWLRRPTQLLGGEAPLFRLDTDAGAHQVEMLLGRIVHGIAA